MSIDLLQITILEPSSQGLISSIVNLKKNIVSLCGQAEELAASKLDLCRLEYYSKYSSYFGFNVYIKEEYFMKAKPT